MGTAARRGHKDLEGQDTGTGGLGDGTWGVRTQESDNKGLRARGHGWGGQERAGGHGDMVRGHRAESPVAQQVPGARPEPGGLRGGGR